MSQRIIKFRIWDKIKNKFVDDFCLLSQTGGISTFTSSGMPIPPLVRANDYEEYVVQQFTGILDKNNKEIYEGDILRDALNEKYEVLIGSYFTKKDVGHGVHLAKNGDRNDFPKTICDMDKGYVVIGNIFENLNLLAAN